MISYLSGKVVAVRPNSITFESNGIGYVINVANNKDYPLNKKMNLYVHKELKLMTRFEVKETFYGFSCYAEKEFFNDLKASGGLTTQSAMLLLKQGYKTLKKAVIDQNVKILNPTLIHKLNPIFMKREINKVEEMKIEISNSLRELGYKQEKINQMLNSFKIKSDMNTFELTRIIQKSINEGKNEVILPKPKVTYSEEMKKVFKGNIPGCIKIKEEITDKDVLLWDNSPENQAKIAKTIEDFKNNLKNSKPKIVGEQLSLFKGDEENQIVPRTEVKFKNERK